MRVERLLASRPGQRHRFHHTGSLSPSGSRDRECVCVRACGSAFGMPGNRFASEHCVRLASGHPGASNPRSNSANRSRNAWQNRSVDHHRCLWQKQGKVGTKSIPTPDGRSKAKSGELGQSQTRRANPFANGRGVVPSDAGRLAALARLRERSCHNSTDDTRIPWR